MSDPSSSSPSGRVAVLAESFLDRYRKGERPALAEYTDRYPELADEIRLVFPAMVDLVGEVLPWQTADSNFWTFNGCTAGTTVPLNWQTPKTICSDAAGAAFGSADWQCRFSYASKGFKSAHPGGANFCLADGSVRFLKASISLATYCALGSRAGSEVVSSDAY